MSIQTSKHPHTTYLHKHSVPQLNKKTEKMEQKKKTSRDANEKMIFWQ